jgi:hypothetical protein
MVDRVDYRIDYISYLRRLSKYDQGNANQSVPKAHQGQENPIHHSPP